jgi:hypothetical protein
MGETAENVAERWGIAREDQDAFAYESHRRAVAAWEAGRFDEEVAAVPVPQRKGAPVSFGRDEGPRADTSVEKLATLRPVFREGGSVTAGNSSTLNDGAAALLLMTPEAARHHGLKPWARILAGASVGVDPRTMGIGPADGDGLPMGARAHLLEEEGQPGRLGGHPRGDAHHQGDVGRVGDQTALGEHRDASDDAGVEALAFGDDVMLLHHLDEALDLVDWVVEEERGPGPRLVGSELEVVEGAGVQRRHLRFHRLEAGDRPADVVAHHAGGEVDDDIRAFGADGVADRRRHLRIPGGQAAHALLLHAQVDVDDGGAGVVGLPGLPGHLLGGDGDVMLLRIREHPGEGAGDDGLVGHGHFSLPARVGRYSDHC